LKPRRRVSHRRRLNRSASVRQAASPPRARGARRGARGAGRAARVCSAGAGRAARVRSAGGGRGARARGAGRAAQMSEEQVSFIGRAALNRPSTPAAAPAPAPGRGAEELVFSGGSWQRSRPVSSRRQVRTRPPAGGSTSDEVFGACGNPVLLLYNHADLHSASRAAQRGAARVLW
jgi:hypothetical protein